MQPRPLKYVAFKEIFWNGAWEGVTVEEGVDDRLTDEVGVRDTEEDKL